MTLADDLKPLAFNIRSIPGQLGIRPYSVAILTGTWNGNNTGRGAKSEQIVPVTEAGGQPPKVREISTEELALGGLGKGSVKIGPITPDFSGGGNPLSNLKPAVDSGQSVHVQLTGPSYPNGALFLIKSLNTDRALHWTIIASPVAEQ